MLFPEPSMTSYNKRKLLWSLQSSSEDLLETNIEIKTGIRFYDRGQK